MGSRSNVYDHDENGSYTLHHKNEIFALGFLVTNESFEMNHSTYCSRDRTLTLSFEFIEF